jgi:hypothetical protein
MVTRMEDQVRTTKEENHLFKVFDIVNLLIETNKQQNNVHHQNNAWGFRYSGFFLFPDGRAAIYSASSPDQVKTLSWSYDQSPLSTWKQVKERLSMSKPTIVNLSLKETTFLQNLLHRFHELESKLSRMQLKPRPGAVDAGVSQYFLCDFSQKSCNEIMRTGDQNILPACREALLLKEFTQSFQTRLQQEEHKRTVERTPYARMIRIPNEFISKQERMKDPLPLVPFITHNVFPSQRIFKISLPKRKSTDTWFMNLFGIGLDFMDERQTPTEHILTLTSNPANPAPQKAEATLYSSPEQEYPLLRIFFVINYSKSHHYKTQDLGEAVPK